MQDLRNYNKELNSICKTLFEQTPIKTFKYQRVYSDGSRTIISNNPELIMHGFVGKDARLKRLYTPLIKNFDRYALVGAWIEGIKDLTIVKILKEQKSDESILFDVKDEFWICEEKEDFLETFAFWVPNNCNTANSFYINNLNVLEQFRLYLLDKAKKIINVADKNRIIKPWRKENENLAYIDAQSDIQVLLDGTMCDEKKARVNFIPNKFHFDISGSKTYITQKEIKCVLELIHGKSNGQIADCLSISPRTVETHLDSLRHKVYAKNRQEVIDFFINLGFSRL